MNNLALKSCFLTMMSFIANFLNFLDAFNTQRVLIILVISSFTLLQGCEAVKCRIKQQTSPSVNATLPILLSNSSTSVLAPLAPINYGQPTLPGIPSSNNQAVNVNASSKAVVGATVDPVQIVTCTRDSLPLQTNTPVVLPVLNNLKPDVVPVSVISMSQPVATPAAPPPNPSGPGIGYPISLPSQGSPTPRNDLGLPVPVPSSTNSTGPNPVPTIISTQQNYIAKFSQPASDAAETFFALKFRTTEQGVSVSVAGIGNNPPLLLANSSSSGFIYQIHEKKLTGANCASNGNVFNPSNCVPATSNCTEVGSLSKRNGNLTVDPTGRIQNAAYVDKLLSLSPSTLPGSYFIGDLSISVSNGNGTKITCANIELDALPTNSTPPVSNVSTPVLTPAPTNALSPAPLSSLTPTGPPAAVGTAYKANFPLTENPFGDFYFSMTFTQSQQGVSVAFGGIVGKDGYISATGQTNLTYQIHERAITGNDCTSAGGVFNPANSQAGDLAARNGPIRVDGTDKITNTPFVDAFLSLSPNPPAGSYFIGDLSLVIKGTDNVRIACANIVKV
jgi:hypothetical protein